MTITETSGFNTSASVSTEVLPGVAITAQPTNQQGVTGSNLIFTVTTSGTPTYQWQVSTNGGGAFTDLSDGSKYSGSQTNTLQVSSLQISDNTNLFRVQVQPASGSCPPVISNSALLTVVVPTVLSNRRITYRVNQ